MKTQVLRATTLLAAAAILLAAGSAAWAGKLQQELSSESTIETVLKRGSLRVGMDTFVPWAMKDKTGQLIGFEIDVATRLAEDMGVKVEFVPTKWSGIIPALITGKFDVIIGGMGILPMRNLKVNFSIPYDYTGMSMVAHKEKAKGFSSLEDFNRPGIILAAKLGATSVMAIQKYMPQAELRQFDSEAQVYQELLNGRVHAAVGNAPTPAFYAVEYPDSLFMPLAENFTQEPIGFAVRKGDLDTLNLFRVAPRPLTGPAIGHFQAQNHTAGSGAARDAGGLRRLPVLPRQG
ncbi:MAG: transporter substrate-binding domain-containing protein, partial [Desulfobacterales bacterium]|nr:transporter substrate-binding domain-containing protein [Desulfobacterales bacterium]